MKTLPASLALLAALIGPAAQADTTTSGSIQLSHFLAPGMLDLGTALPGTFRFTSATLTFNFTGWGEFQQEGSALPGGYALSSRTVGGLPCPRSGQVYCSFSSLQYERISTTRMVQGVERAELTVGAYSTSADNGGLLAARREDHGRQFERNVTTEGEYEFGRNYDADGNLASIIYSYDRKTEDFYTRNYWDFLAREKNVSSLTLTLDADSLTLLNSNRQIAYQLNTSRLFLDNATLDYSGVSAVPEPANAAMLLAGLAVAGIALRRRHG
ncbi:PEP-CTERM sorting domain-containing protein [Massilia sp. YIM B04103]|uniref:PEP-CTERM sorting domain-containing protein n=1 Tax=Massilia sp. YIM B04103 TaxID=2963106 RepID=UPI00210C65BD|nr:PEP-CTERM sorting domain-containing protein [Massilia sp. YIM B04103]